MLTNRYLTFKLLDEIQIDGYDKYREIVKKDIDLIDNETKINELKSFNKITLKQAFEINKIYKKNKSIFQRINDGDYDLIQNISFSIIKLAFSLYYNKKPYLSDINQKLQYYVLQGGVLGLRLVNRMFAADCLEHSLQEVPEDIEITEGEVIDEIKKDSNFQKIINNLIDENKGNDKMDNVQIITFAKGDLALSLHNATLEISGIKQKNNKWKLNIIISDLYDFTEFKKLQEYISNSGNYVDNIENFAAITGNNLAIIGSSCKVVNIYNIMIKFEIEDWEV